MDNKNIQPEPLNKPIAPSQDTQPPAAASLKPQADSPLEVSDSVAQSLLAINGIQSEPKKKLHLPIGLLVSIGLLIVVLIIASYMLGNMKPNGSSSNSNSTQNSSGSNGSQATYKQINKDVNSCSNLVNAVSQC